MSVLWPPFFSGSQNMTFGVHQCKILTQLGLLHCKYAEDGPLGKSIPLKGIVCIHSLARLLRSNPSAGRRLRQTPSMMRRRHAVRVRSSLTFKWRDPNLPGISVEDV